MKRYAVLFVMAMLVLIVPTSAQAKTLKLTYLEREVQGSDQFVDADHSGADAPPTNGDYFTGRSNLYKVKSNNKLGKKVGGVSFKGTFTEVTETTYDIAFTAKVTLPGGHIYVEFTETGRLDDEGMSAAGDIDRYPIKRGDGRYKGYKGTVTITVIRPGREGSPEISRDVFKLKK